MLTIRNKFIIKNTANIFPKPIVIAGNYWGDGTNGILNTTSSVLVSSSLDGDMVVLNYSNLTINSGHTLTTSNRCKGMLVYVDGDCNINGTLSMTARGANVNPVDAGVGTNGLSMFRQKISSPVQTVGSNLTGAGPVAVSSEFNQSLPTNGISITIPRIGGKGADGNIRGETTARPGKSGSLGSGACGGGGSGGKHPEIGAVGSGSAGTCFSGGAGSGGSGWGSDSLDAGLYGGVGGNAPFTFNDRPSAGGAGNPGGTGYFGTAGGNGTGGLLFLMVKGNLTIGSSGRIESKGVDGGSSSGGASSTGGGASGGGTIAVFYAGTFVTSSSSILTVAGGVGGAGSSVGGDGGSGSFFGPYGVDI